MAFYSGADQTGRMVLIPEMPQRIVSLVPSQSELCAYLGLEKRVVGITKFCIHPADWFRSKTRVGGTKSLDMDKIRSLEPDLIIGNREENERIQIETLSEEFPVWVSDVRTFAGALEMIESLGRITGAPDRSQELVRELHGMLPTPLSGDRIPAAYLIWKDPLMVAGSDTFIHSMMELAGFSNVYADRDDRYPTTDMADLSRLAPRIVLLSTEPFPFSEKHAEAMRPELPESQVILVDGEMFSWYGSRMCRGLPYLTALRKQVLAG